MWIVSIVIFFSYHKHLKKFFFNASCTECTKILNPNRQVQLNHIGILRKATPCFKFGSHGSQIVKILKTNNCCKVYLLTQLIKRKYLFVSEYLYLVSILLFTIESFSLHVQEFQNSKVELENVNTLHGAKTWVVLVAGSSGWANYRHQVLNVLFV